ncbi:hypothetical protein [Bremerella sp.]|uniref:hypothetical protein n=1 Tax=Bremerella sp. TaxID=2795602 RepID=UPI00391B95A3
MLRRNIPGHTYALLAGLLLLSIGCTQKSDKWTDGRPPVYPSSGQILLDGEPIAEATVTFQPVDPTGRGGSAITDSSGYFDAQTFEPGDGLTEGMHNVSIRKIQMVDRNGNVVEEIREPGSVVEKNLVPDKYSKFDKSGLQVTISIGKNDLGKIELSK